MKNRKQFTFSGGKSTEHIRGGDVIFEPSVEVFKVLPTYKKLSKARKINALGLLKRWIEEEISTL